jgi:hypothetical protein
VENGMAKKSAKSTLGSARNEASAGLRTNLLELSGFCPFDQTNPEDCPLFLLRRMRPARRTEWLNALSEADMLFLAAYHRVCLGVKVDTASAHLRAEPPAK